MISQGDPGGEACLGRSSSLIEPAYVCLILTKCQNLNITFPWYELKCNYDFFTLILCEWVSELKVGLSDTFKHTN